MKNKEVCVEVLEKLGEVVDTASGLMVYFANISMLDECAEYCETLSYLTDEFNHIFCDISKKIEAQVKISEN